MCRRHHRRDQDQVLAALQAYSIGRFRAETGMQETGRARPAAGVGTGGRRAGEDHVKLTMIDATTATPASSSTSANWARVEVFLADHGGRHPLPARPTGWSPDPASPRNRHSVRDPALASKLPILGGNAWGTRALARRLAQQDPHPATLYAARPASSPPRSKDVFAGLLKRGSPSTTPPLAGDRAAPPSRAGSDSLD